MAPPTSGPMAMARPAMPPHAPSATARRSGGIAADRIVRVSGVTIAPPTPWMARARIEAIRRRRQGGQSRTADEDPHPDQEDALPTEPVAESGAGDEQDRERQGVRVDDPLEVLKRCAEVGLDDRQRGRHDEVVESDHEQGERGDDECPERVRACAGQRRTPFQGCDLVVTKYEGEKRGAAGDGQEAPPASGAIGWCLRNPLRDHDSGEPSISRAAATLRSIPSAKNRWISSFDAPLSRSTA